MLCLTAIGTVKLNSRHLDDVKVSTCKMFSLFNHSSRISSRTVR